MAIPESPRFAEILASAGCALFTTPNIQKRSEIADAFAGTRSIPVLHDE